MKTIVFVVPPTLEVGQIANKMRRQEATVPYGVLSIVSYLNHYLDSNKISVNIIDFNTKPYSQLNMNEQLEMYQENILDLCPDVVGISVMYNHMYPYIKTISDRTKNILKNCMVIAGGACVMAYYEELLYDVDSLDAISYSEGEIPILELLESDNGSELIKHHPSFLTKADMSLGKQPKAKLIDNIDEIPKIDFGLVDLKEYGQQRSSFRANKKINEVILPISTTRGCPYNCVFCLAGSLHGKKVRKMSVDRVIEDVRYMINEYGINTLSIEDDQFLIDVDRAKEILKRLKEFNLTLIADSGFTVSMIDQELADLMYEAGLTMAIIAIESGSEYILNDIIDKPINLLHVKDAVRFLRNSGLNVHAFLVIGLPGEREEDRQQTIDFIRDIGIDWSYITCATPVKGSRLYDICVEHDYIDLSYKGEDAFYVSVINTDTFTSEEITKKAYLMNLEMNFVNNYRMSVGDFHNTIKYMEHVCKKYPNHAFANYYLAKAMENHGIDKNLYQKYYDNYSRIIRDSVEWKEYAEYFGLELME